ncbi:MAG: flagellar biosynthesis anti-sigma factor FlgM [Acidobacteriaceae bacterium]|nr:flagellar biosynthesis anti-sigma factor FlgM [Acidobacteriaceae bacterium]MBV8570118.1 flagellar biosynthesis anti-sigma factor FlgM [Acidobacteriaceae bacterium]
MGLSTAAATAPAPEQILLEIDPARAAKVEALREQYQSGSYEVDLEKVSEKLIEAHLESY